MEPREWAERIAAKLLEYDRGRLKETKDTLILNHAKMTGCHTGFLYGGKFHSNYPPDKHFTLNKMVLHPTLHNEAGRYMDAVKLADREEMQIKQGIYSLLDGCTSMHDLRDTLPEALVSLFLELSSLDRTRPEAYTILNNPIKMHSWRVISDVIFTRFASELIS